MSSYLKPQSPLYHKEEDAYFYPLTTEDQVIMDDGSRLSGNNFLSVDKNGSNIGEPNHINADTLGGKSPEYYATSEDLFGVYSEIKNRLYHVDKSSRNGNTISFKLYRGSVEGRLNMFIYGDNNGPTMYGAITINIYRTLHSDPNYLSCKSILHTVDDAGNLTTNKIDVSWDGTTDPINITLSSFDNWAAANIISTYKLE